MQLERASRLTVEFDGVSWALCHERTPFVEMSLSGISLTNLRNRDQSGEPSILCISSVSSMARQAILFRVLEAIHNVLQGDLRGGGLVLVTLQ